MSVTEKLKRMGAKRILLQYPEGLKFKIQEIVKTLESKGFEVILSCEPCFGACDLRDTEAERLGCDTVLHIGHSSLGIKTEVPVVYWEYFFNVDPLPILEKEIKKLKKFKKIGLVTSIQFVKAMNKVKEYLEEKKKKIFVYKSLKYPGQVLGCDVSAAKKIEEKVDCFLYVGAGKFHPLGVAKEVKKPVFSLDLEKKCIYSLEKEKLKWLKKKAWYDSKLNDARKIGIIISWKKGQNRVKEARKLRKELEKEGKEVYILAFDSVTREKLEGLKLDYLINLACPRLTDDILLF